jgi:hypothetical protein
VNSLLRVKYYAQLLVAVPEEPTELLATTTKYAQRPLAELIDCVKEVPEVLPEANAVSEPPLLAAWYSSQ